MRSPRRPSRPGYVAAKHGVLGLVKTLALEGAEVGSARPPSAPAYVRTPLVEAQVPSSAGLDAVLEPQAVKRLLEPSEVADLVAFLLGPTGRGITGGRAADRPRLDRAVAP